MLSRSMLLRRSSHRATLCGLAAAAACGALVIGADARAISGVCPDGSIFIVQRRDSIPCRGAKQVAPADIPPVKPEFLPRPYGWEVFNRETDPNNPYNLVEVGRAQALPEMPREDPPPDAPPPEPEIAPGPTRELAPSGASVASAEPSRPAADPSVPGGLELSLGSRELEHLRAIVAASQERAPATFVRRGDDGSRGVTLRLAHSSAFAARVGQALAARGVPGGRVVVFRAEASEPGAFFGNLTFVQGHMAFHPDQSDPTQFGLLEGALGPLAPGESALGYAVLPAALDLAQSVDVYWDDQLFTAQLRP
jgi:hypothetical protein